jgi:L-2,4-diaminobutyric acid acetyltransferase
MTEPDDVLIALRRIIRATDQNSKRLSRSAGLTIPQSVLMRAIANHPGATLGFLTQAVSLSQATVTTIVDRLEERGLVQRQRNAGDKRVVNVVLTERGKVILSEAPPPLQLEFMERFAGLPESQRTVIVSALDTVAAMMDAREIDASPILTLGRVAEQVAKAPSNWNLRMPDADDGSRLNALVRVCPPLDQNSIYCNLLQCTHFRETTVVAERDGRLLGAISAYLPPDHPDTLFVWQVAVHPDARREGLGSRMLGELFTREAMRDVRYLETTVTAGNEPSKKLFEAFASSRAASVTREPLFDRERHLDGRQDSEILLRIGPLRAAQSSDRELPHTTTPVRKH